MAGERGRRPLPVVTDLAAPDPAAHRSGRPPERSGGRTPQRKPMTPARPRLGLEPLSDRCLPATFGIPWADPSHLTLSFAPDGTETPYGPSALASTLGAVTPTATWQREVLRAFQTWAMYATVDIGLTDDGGLAFGTTGAVQSDSRFGDIRVGAAALSPTLLASGAPFSFSGTTLSGDVVFNAANSFGVGPNTGWYDIFSVALHES